MSRVAHSRGASESEARSSVVRQPRRPVVAEIVGVAGAGKTTLVNTLIRRDPGLRAGIDLTRVEIAPWHVANALRFVPSYMRHVPGRWFSRGETRDMAYLEAWWRSLVRDPGARVLVFDHGPIFRLVHLSEFGPPFTRTRAFRHWWNSALARWASTVDDIVWLDAPDEVLLQRIQSRDGKHPVEAHSEREANAFLVRYRAAYERVVEGFVSASHTELLRFDTSGRSPDKIADDVLAALRSQAKRSTRDG